VHIGATTAVASGDTGRSTAEARLTGGAAVARTSHLPGPVVAEDLSGIAVEDLDPLSAISRSDREAPRTIGVACGLSAKTGATAVGDGRAGVQVDVIRD